eukprot:m.61704 g.61704  ORF g.61704 m.61704 type:complete len:302 (-) comp13740_c0_seq1:314-1219(-)
MDSVSCLALRFDLRIVASISPLGQGGTASVRVCVDEQNVTMAVKIFHICHALPTSQHLEWAMDKEGRSLQFLHDARCPNIVPFHGIACIDQETGLLMKLLKPMTRQLGEGHGKFPFSLRWKCAQDLCQTLAWMEAKGVAMYDIKLENTLFDPETSTALFCDISLGGPSVPAELHSPIATPQFAPPEFFDDPMSPTPASMCFQFCYLLWWLFLGQRVQARPPSGFVHDVDWRRKFYEALYSNSSRRQAQVAAAGAGAGGGIPEDVVVHLERVFLSPLSDLPSDRPSLAALLADISILCQFFQ